MHVALKLSSSGQFTAVGAWRFSSEISDMETEVADKAFSGSAKAVKSQGLMNHLRQRSERGFQQIVRDLSKESGGSVHVMGTRSGRL